MTQYTYSFEEALEFVLKWEGGYSDRHNDLGKATNMGIRQTTYDEWRKEQNLPAKSVKYITYTEMETIYRKKYWNEWASWGLYPRLYVAVFNDAVNMGVKRAKDLLLACHKDIKLFLHMQEILYDRFATVPGQEENLAGWLNRLSALRKYLGVS